MSTDPPAAAVENGHDMIGTSTWWQCRRCRRTASRDGSREWGTAVSEPCADTEAPLSAVRRAALQRGPSGVSETAGSTLRQGSETLRAISRPGPAAV
jgi:hypothetical protein